MLRTRKVYNWLIGAHRLLYPHECMLCGAKGEHPYDLCLECLGDLQQNRTGCPRCGIPLNAEGVICGPCSRRSPPFERTVAAFRYAPPLDYLLQQLKFHRRLELAPLLGSLLASTVIRSGGPLPALIIPVPMSHARLRQRGYNQALELARPLSRQLGISIDRQRCRRVRHTPAQTSLKGREERRKNMRGAFVVDRGLPSHVAILDDVITTGATVAELARTLRRSGVDNIEVWACARAGSG